MINETLSAMSEGQVVQYCHELIAAPVVIYYFIAVTLVIGIVFWFGVKGVKSKKKVTKLILIATVINAVIASAIYFLPHVMQKLNFFGGF